VRFLDFTRLILSSIVANRVRTLLTTLGIAIGIAAVVLLTSIGEGVNQLVLSGQSIRRDRCQLTIPLPCQNSLKSRRL